MYSRMSVYDFSVDILSKKPDLEKSPFRGWH